MMQFDVIVVGASIAGASTACLLGRAGYRVLLLDRARFPRSKVCGEGLMPAGVKILRQMAIDPEGLPGREFRGIRFHIEKQPSLELSFSELSPRWRGLAVSRERLDAALLRQATRFANVELRQGFNVRFCRLTSSGVEVGGDPGQERFPGRVLVAADGIRSRFHRWAGIERVGVSTGRFALRAWFREFAHSQEWVDVYCSRDGEAYVAPLGPRSARVTMLLNSRPSKPRLKSREAWFMDRIGAFPEVMGRISGRPERVDATAPVSRRISRCHGERLLLVGDAAGTVDPITGQGMTLALRDAQLAARVLEEPLASDQLSESRLETYTDQRDVYFRQASDLSQRVLTMVKHPWLAGRFRKALANNPQLRYRLLASAVSPGLSSGLSWGDRLRLVAGF